MPSVITPSDSMVFNTTEPVVSIKSFYYSAKNPASFLIFEKNRRVFKRVTNKKILHTDTIQTEDILDFYPLNPDSVFLLTKNSILLLDSNSQIRKQYYIPLKDNYLGVNYDFPFEIKIPYAFFYQYPSYPITSKNALVKFLSTNREVIFNLQTDSIENNQYGTYPADLKINNKYVFNPIRCVSDSYLVYIYPHSDTLYICHWKKHTTKKIPIRSKYFSPNQTFDFDKQMDYNYIAQYLTENSRFIRISYNPYKKEYCIVLAHKMSYENKDGTINRWIDKPWSLIVLDENFNTQHEFVFPAKKYAFTHIIHTVQYSLIGEYYSNCINKTLEKKYYVFKDF